MNNAEFRTILAIKEQIGHTYVFKYFFPGIALLTILSNITSAMIDLISLPNPRPLLPSLLEAGFSHENATVASQLYQQRAEEFKRRTETTLIAAWQKMATLPGASASSLAPLTRREFSTFTEVYLRCLEEWKEEMVQFLKQAPKVPSKAAPPRNSCSFNHVSTPTHSRTPSEISGRNICHYWSIFSKRTRFRHMQTKSFSPRNRTCNTGKFMYG